MRIGIVLANTPTYSETFFRNKIRFLKEEGFEITLFTGHANQDFNLCPVNVGYHAGNGKLKDLSSLIVAILRLILTPKRTVNLFRTNKSDGVTLKQNIRSLLLCSHIISVKLDWLHFGFATMALGRENIASIIGAKMVVSIRGYDMMVYPEKKKGCYQLLWKHLDKLHYISDALLTQAIKHGFNQQLIPAIKITPAINTDNFSTEIKPLNKKLKITTTARLHWIKGIDYTLDALSMLKQSGIDFDYCIIGEGQERERLIFAAYQLGIADNVKLLGKLSHKEIIPILAETDLYIQYSINEGFCNSVLEAQAMGCFCLVSDAEGLTENILHNKTGIVVPKRSPKLLYEAIQKALTMDNEERSKITNNAKTRVKQEFNLAKQKESFIQLYAS